MLDSLRVAVAGASGIGKHHAKWFAQWGCEVVAFSGTSEASCKTTAATLRELFGFDGGAYTDLGNLIANEHPHIVDICTPNERHYDGVETALSQGCHVLCEKPLIWDARESDLVQRGETLLRLAREKNLHYGVATQYAAAAAYYDSATGYRRDSDELTEIGVEMETLARQQRGGREVWIDMGPHPLSLLLSWMPEGRIDLDSLKTDLSARSASASFVFDDGERRCDCFLLAKDADSGGLRRRFGVNGAFVDVSGRNNDQGVYESVLRFAKAELLCPDFMSLLIKQFVDAVRGEVHSPMVPASVGLRNLELQLQILNAAR